MRLTIYSLLSILLIASLLILPKQVTANNYQQNYVTPFNYLPTQLPARFSVDGKFVWHGRPLKAVVFDPTPPTTLRRVPSSVAVMALEKITSTSFSITYLPAGSTDIWGEPCYSFPLYAKTAFEAAANVWANILDSSVPVTIQACWANLGATSILGYSGSPSVRDFPSAPRSNTWYAQSLGNAIAGYDLYPLSSDMAVTFNSLFNWYYGTDGNVGSSLFRMGKLGYSNKKGFTQISCRMLEVNK
ncbi:MAG: hypothetical protein OEM02_16025 [Desulfobulbaceae bacterium]|nr:hypothetical protein [Desulfobulbaceae bacterium]